MYKVWEISPQIDARSGGGRVVVAVAGHRWDQAEEAVLGLGMGGVGLLSQE